MSAKKIINHYALMSRAVDHLHAVSSCFRAEKSGVEYTEEERKKMHEAARLLSQAKDIVTEIYTTRIGRAVTAEIRCNGKLTL